MVLGARGAMGYVLGRGAGAAAAADWWLSGGVSAANAIVAYQPKGSASLAASYTNLANPGTYNAVPSAVPPSFVSANGWGFNGSSQYVSSVAVPTSADWSAIIRFSGKTSTNARGLLGAVATSPSTVRGIEIAMDAVTVNTIFYANGANVYAEQSPRLSSGVLCVAGKSAYRNGTLDATIPTGTGVPAYALFIGAINVAGAPQLHCDMIVQAFALYNTTLSAAQVAAISAAMAAL